jgi:hypothetical protein
MAGRPNQTLKTLLESNDELDYLIASVVFGEHDVPLTDPQHLRLNRADRAYTLLEDNAGNTRVVVGLLMEHATDPISQTTAYQACNDAKRINGYATGFDLLAELHLKKNRIEKAIVRAIDAMKLREQSDLEKQHLEVLRDIASAIERLKPEEPKKLNFVIHGDVVELGWASTEEYLAARNEIMTGIVPKVRKALKTGETYAG